MKNDTTTPAFCIFHCAPDKQPAWHLENGYPATYATGQEALKEILDVCRDHLQQIEDGDRELEDGIGFDDWIEEVDLHPDGSITDEDGTTFGKRCD